MKTVAILGIALIMLGIVVFAYKASLYIPHEKVIDFGLAKPRSTQSRPSGLRSLPREGILPGYGGTSGQTVLP